jgi:succinate dehydrogenase hydrophobic anchor subunit
MGLDHVLLDFLARTATGAASVLLVIFVVGISIPRRAPVTTRRTLR